MYRVKAKFAHGFKSELEVNPIVYLLDNKF